MTTFRRAAGWLAFLLAGAGCGGPPEAIQDRVELKQFESCQELESYIKDTTAREMYAAMSDTGGGLRLSAGGVPSAAEQSSGGVDRSTAAPDYSQTNVQVAGVDEADFVKTDGLRVFYLVGGRLFVLKSWPAAEAGIQSTTKIEGWPREMFLAGSKLVVFSEMPQYAYDDTVPPPVGMPARPDYYAAHATSDATKVTVFDVSTDTPALLAAYYLAGSYANSRRIDNSVRIVLHGTLRWPEIRYWLEDWDRGNPFGYNLAMDRLKSANEKKIRERPLADWLPKSFVVNGTNRVQVPYQCGDFHKPNTSTRLGLATVATLDLDAIAGGVSQTVVVAEVGEVYASTQALYLASPHWWWSTLDGRHDHTYLHKFDISAKDRALYVASGGVSGSIVDQFSMDEDKGFFRMATTTTSWGSGLRATSTENRVYVLAEHSGRMEVVGATPNLAEGERIFSSRFAGDKGFVVTFRQVDPLFTLDLSDPTDPRVVGALKIPGFSTYIHMLDDTHLLTIGEDAGAVTLQLFDVSELADPVLTAKQVVGTRYGSSEALREHKAFNYFAKTGLLAIPFTDYSPVATSLDYWARFVSQLRVFRINAAGSITPVGTIDHADLYKAHARNNWQWWYMPDIRRSVQIEDFVYSFSYAGVEVHKSTDLKPTGPAAALKVIPLALEL